MRKLKATLLLLILTLFVSAQAWSATLIMYPKFKGLDSSGAPLVGGLLYTYKAGTDTLKATYTSRAATVENTNPVVLDSNGEATIYGTGQYKFVLKTSAGVTVWTMDNITGNNEIDFTTIADYSNDFDAAVTSIGATPTTLYVDSTGTMSTTVTIPATLTVVIQKGGVLDMGGNALTSNGSIIVQDGTITNDAALTINGPFSAGMGQVFTSTSAVTFNRGTVSHGINVKWFGAKGDGSTDDQAAINLAANSGRADSVPVYFPTGDYYVTVSLNFSGANGQVSGYTDGWKIFGDGRMATQITGHLSDPHPVVDMVNNSFSVIRGLRIQGDSGGSQICGLMHGEIASIVANGNNVVDVAIAGTFSEAAYINMGSDLTTLDKSFFDGPCGVIFTTTKDAITGNVIASAYQTLDTTGEGTFQRIINCEIWGSGGDTNNWDSAIVSDETYKVVIRDSYIAQITTAKAGIMVDGDNGVTYDHHTIEFVGSRYENQTSPTAAGTFLWVATEDGLGDSNFDGFAGGLGSPDTGQMIYLGGGDIYSSKIRLESGSASEWTHTVQRSAAEDITNSEIWEMVASGALKSANAAIFGEGNIFHIFQWNSAWLNVSGNCVFHTNDQATVTVYPRTAPKGPYNTGYAGGTVIYRGYVGLAKANYQSTGTTGPAGSDETLDSFTVPSNIPTGNTELARTSIRVTAHGTTAANANAKTIKLKFGVSGSESTIVYNDQTASPNSLKWSIFADLVRAGSTTEWTITAHMMVGNVLQTIFSDLGGYGDPNASTVKLLITGDAAASDITVQMMKVEIF